MTTYERALQMDTVLIGAADNRQSLTYDQIGQKVGLPRQAVSNHLAHIMRHCQHHGLPPLTVLVVQSGTGRPGAGLTTTTDNDRDREAVFGHEWYRLRPLTVEVRHEASSAVAASEER